MTDNTVGSLTQLQESVLIGSILGDGYLRRILGRKDAFLEINHSIKAKEYVDWKYEIFKNISQSSPKERAGNEGRVAYRFFTRQHPRLTEWLNLFYHNGRKIIPKNLKLNPQILAVWFMDDGSKTNKNDVYLNTQQFSLADQKRLLFLLRQINLKARLNRDKKYWRIRFLKESVGDLNKMIKPHVIPSMAYKLSDDPVETHPKK